MEGRGDELKGRASTYISAILYNAHANTGEDAYLISVPDQQAPQQKGNSAYKRCREGNLTDLIRACGLTSLRTNVSTCFFISSKSVYRSSILHQSSSQVIIVFIIRVNLYQSLLIISPYFLDAVRRNLPALVTGVTNGCSLATIFLQDVQLHFRTRFTTSLLIRT